MLVEILCGLYAISLASFAVKSFLTAKGAKDSKGDRGENRDASIS
jgi:hypothetical protein